MIRTIKTTAQAKWISARTETKDSKGNTIAIDNEGQFCITLVPLWTGGGKTLMDGTMLEEGKQYKITIEIEE